MRSSAASDPARPVLRPAAEPHVLLELREDLRVRQRILRAAAHVRLADLEDGAVPERRPDVAGEVPRIGIRPGRSRSATLAAERRDVRVGGTLVGELREARLARRGSPRRCNRASRTSPA